MDDIEKLKVRVERDPHSRLFLPLAEEYRKAGMLDEAISVLLRGLERHPNYTSARTALGKMYLEKNMIDEAKKEFEEVITAIPDNLFAHKKLAEIYRDLGEIDKAIAEYKAVIKINPLDEEARSFIEGAEKREEVNVPEEMESVTEPPLSEELKEFSLEEAPPELSTEAEGLLEEKGDAPFPSEEEFFGIPEDQVFDLSKEEPEEVLPEDMMEVSSPFSLTEEFKETFEIVEEPGEVGSHILHEGFQGFEGLELSEKDELDFREADGLVSRGEYFKALDNYKAMLKEYPDNKRVLQRIAELKGLIKILGKDKEIVSKLEAFLEGILRRRDEFFGRS